MNTYTITLPIPPRCLSMNGRSHWRVKAKATKAARANAHAIALEACSHRPLWAMATIQYTFVFTERRERDDDNFITRMKPCRDGIADAGIVINDHVFTTLPTVLRVDRTAARPHVIVTVSKI